IPSSVAGWPPADAAQPWGGPAGSPATRPPSWARWRSPRSLHVLPCLLDRHGAGLGEHGKHVCELIRLHRRHLPFDLHGAAFGPGNLELLPRLAECPVENRHRSLDACSLILTSDRDLVQGKDRVLAFLCGESFDRRQRLRLLLRHAARVAGGPLDEATFCVSHPFALSLPSLRLALCHLRHSSILPSSGSLRAQHAADQGSPQGGR